MICIDMKAITHPTPNLLAARPLLILATGLLTGALISWLLFTWQAPHFAYVDPDKVFEDFALTQELEQRLSLSESAHKAYLQQLGLRIEHMQNREAAPQDSLVLLQNEYQQKYSQFSQERQQKVAEFNAQAITQMSQYLADFCQEQGYTYLLSHGKNGALMGADPEADVTQAAITYVNHQYQAQ